MHSGGADMDLYIAKAIAFDLALHHKRILVCGSRTETRQIVAETEKILHALEDLGAQIIRTYSRTNGRERIDLINGGMLAHAASHPSIRGFDVDLVYMAKDLAEHEDWWTNACIATNARRGEVVVV